MGIGVRRAIAYRCTFRTSSSAIESSRPRCPVRRWIESAQAWLTMTNAETDWSRLNRAVEQVTTRLAAAQFEEDFQSIGHLVREAFISLGQAVYDPARHPSEDGVTLSATDAKRMLTAYVAAELSGAGNEEARRFARAAVVYADAVTHKRSASRLDAELVAAAIEAVIKIIAVLARRTTPVGEPWRVIELDGRYFAWSGPILHQLNDRSA